MVRRLLFLGVLVVSALSLSGCFARVRTRPVYAGATVQAGYAPGVVVYDAPPQPQVVVNTPPPAPYQGAVWVQGHWQWNGAQYIWMDGTYIQPRVGHVYVQPRWQRRGTGYVYVQGNWRPHQRGSVRVQQRRRGHGRARGRGGVQVQPNRVRVPPSDVRVRGSVQVQ